MARGIQRIVVAYDGSPSARRAVLRAAEIAGADATVGIVTVAPLLVADARSAPVVDPREVDERDRLLEHGRTLLARRGVAGVTLPRTGDAATEILAAVREADADLVVVGTRGRSRLKGLLLGSVSSAVVGGAPCDVLVVR